MKKTLLLLLLIFSSNLFAQTKTIDEFDKFTKEKIVQINVSNSKKWRTSDNITKGFLEYLFLSFKKIGDNNYLQLGINNNDFLRCVANEGKLILLLEDDTTIEIFNNKETDCSHVSISGLYKISEDQLNELSTKNLKEFRVYYSEGYTDYTIKTDKFDLIKKSVLLFKENI